MSELDNQQDAKHPNSITTHGAGIANLDGICREACPHCGVSMQGSKIPEKIRPLYGGPAHFSRVIGIYSMDEDRTIAWKCPECDQRWPVDNYDLPT